jgi:type II secretory pathway component HofQ
MKKALILVIFFLIVSFGEGNAQNNIPYLNKNGTATQLIVKNEPFLMIAGEVHNSSASTEEYMKPLFPKLKAMNLNSVFVTLAWEQFEPKEGFLIIHLLML